MAPRYQFVVIVNSHCIWFLYNCELPRGKETCPSEEWQMLCMPQETTRARNCRSSLRCSGYGGRHHASICSATHGDSNSTWPDFAPRSPQLQKIQTTNPDSHTLHPVGTSNSKQQSNIIPLYFIRLQQLLCILLTDQPMVSSSD